MSEERFNLRPIFKAEIPLIVDLAQRAWPATYQGILPEAQIKYMMDLFYTPAALEEQMIEKKHQFIIAAHHLEHVGFASFGRIEDPGVYKLHKIYILPDWQGRGVGRALLKYILSYIQNTGGTTLILNVNRNNKAKSFYERLGFTVEREEDINIGGDYYMNDFVMRKRIE